MKLLVLVFIIDEIREHQETEGIDEYVKEGDTIWHIQKLSLIHI